LPTRTPRGTKPAKMDAAALLAAAQQVFAREGLDGASLRAIAKEAGCDPSLIYYYFQNKEAMFVAILEERIPPFVHEIRRLANPRDPRGTAEKLWAVLRIFNGRAHDRGFRSMIRGQIARGAEGVPEILERRLIPAQVALRAIFRRGMRRGELREGQNPFLLALFFLRMQAEILDIVPIFAPRITRMSPEEALGLAMRDWFTVFWRGIAANPDAPLPFVPAL
jgi:AcrR family transcriptional regulator